MSLQRLLRAPLIFPNVDQTLLFRPPLTHPPWQWRIVLAPFPSPPPPPPAPVRGAALRPPRLLPTGPLCRLVEGEVCVKYS